MHTLADQFPRSGPRLSPLGIGTVILAHALVLAGLLKMQMITLPEPLAVLSVSLLAPDEVIKPAPEVAPPTVLPKPRPVQQRPVQAPAPTMLAAPADAPAEAPTPTPLAVLPAPTFAAPTPPIAAAPTQPRFDADYLDNPKPTYPSLARRMGEEGRVVLRVQVDTGGNAAEVQLHTSSGSPRLDQSALTTVRRWKFIPARLGKEPIAAWVLVPVAFTLKD